MLLSIDKRRIAGLCLSFLRHNIIPVLPAGQCLLFPSCFKIIYFEVFHNLISGFNTLRYFLLRSIRLNNLPDIA